MIHHWMTLEVRTPKKNCHKTNTLITHFQYIKPSFINIDETLRQET